MKKEVVVVVVSLNIKQANCNRFTRSSCGIVVSSF